MLCGTAPIASLLARAPNFESDPSVSLDLGKAQWLQFSYELPGTRTELFPPGLHPTTPVIVTLQIWRAFGGPFGNFGLAQVRLSCRAGLRIRAFLLASVIDGDAAWKALHYGFGFSSTAGRVTLHRRADRIEGAVDVNDKRVLEGTLYDPEVLEPSALQHIGNMHLVNTSRGPRLLQVETDITTLGLQRGRQQLATFDGDFWGLPNRPLHHGVIGASADIEVSLPAIRFVQDPMLIATVGTTKLEEA